MKTLTDQQIQDLCLQNGFKDTHGYVYCQYSIVAVPSTPVDKYKGGVISAGGILLFAILLAYLISG